MRGISENLLSLAALTNAIDVLVVYCFGLKLETQELSHGVILDFDV
jgi:hypothetical protein